MTFGGRTPPNTRALSGQTRQQLLLRLTVVRAAPEPVPARDVGVRRWGTFGPCGRAS
ncbi:hypothetical protein RHRU231_370007 [Rhodococcus ruber]|uniref:Uncharacterized protein n=1 Tax=Rhodococcus ruber TaxID=1830 RepID=A0A098BIC9_9NOCA|nr:hypothetical protein RHRU231_370007 [Rhodococcus ruber]